MASKRAQKDRAERDHAEFFQPRGGNRPEAADDTGQSGALMELLAGQKELLKEMGELRTQMAKVEGAMGKMNERLNKVEGEAAKMEMRMVAVECTTLMHNQKIQAMEEDIKYHGDFIPTAATFVLALENRVEMLENQRRANIIRMVGVPPMASDSILLDVVRSLVDGLSAGEPILPNVVIQKAVRLRSTKKVGGQ